MNEVGVPTWIGELAFGAVVILALLGYIWFKPAVASLMERCMKAEDQRDSLIEAYRAEVIPALREASGGTVRSTEVLEMLVPLMAEVQKALTERKT